MIDLIICGEKYIEFLNNIKGLIKHCFLKSGDQHVPNLMYGGLLKKCFTIIK